MITIVCTCLLAKGTGQTKSVPVDPLGAASGATVKEKEQQSLQLPLFSPQPRKNHVLITPIKALDHTGPNELIRIPNHLILESSTTTMSAAINAIATGSQTTGDPNISWPTERTHIPNEWHPSSLRPGPQDPDSLSDEASDSDSIPDFNHDASIFPQGKRSLSGISLRAFCLGTSLGLTTSLTLVLLALQIPYWRVPFFIAALSLFHFLEFYITATYNTPAADVKAFLLSSNGWAYNVAHGTAMVECLVSQYFWPNRWTLNVLSVTLPVPILGQVSLSLLLVLGLGLTLLGQIIRSLAMKQAASNFNHHVQSQHKAGHVLVRHGLYAILRHPSYFGFFWWGLGTQLVLGNVVCFVGYALVLWKFFSTRIHREFPFSFLFFSLRVADAF